MVLQRLCRHSLRGQEPVSPETETQTTVKGSLGPGLGVLWEEDLLRVQTVNLPRETSQSASF